MELTLLTVPACASAAAFEEQLAAALAAIRARWCDAVRWPTIRRRPGRMHGSPTLLINGVDPFAGPGEPPSLSCRLFRDAAGRISRAPSVEALRQALAAAGHD